MSRVRRAVTLAVAASAATITTLLTFSPPAAAAEPECVAIVLCGAPDQDPLPPPEEPAPAGDGGSAPPPAEPARPSAEEAAAELLVLLNRDRRAHGLPPLSRRADVDGIAASWSRQIASDGKLSHNDAYFTAESRRRLGAKALGENVARNQTPEAAHAALMNSPGHRANILDRRFLVVGLGAVDAHGSWWITQNFLQPRSAGTAAPAGGTAAAPPHRASTASPQRPPAPAPAPAASPATVPVRALDAGSVPAAPAAPRVVEVASVPRASAPVLDLADAVGPRDPSPPYRAAAIAAVAALAGLACTVAAEHRRRRWLATVTEGSPLRAAYPA